MQGSKAESTRYPVGEQADSRQPHCDSSDCHLKSRVVLETCRRGTM